MRDLVVAATSQRCLAADAGSVSLGMASPAVLAYGAVKVGIVVPYSLVVLGRRVEHAELQCEALRKLGFEVKTLIGNDPPGKLHAHPAPAARPARQPAAGRHPDRPLGDRARERLAAEHRAQPTRDPSRESATLEQRAAST